MSLTHDRCMKQARELQESCEIWHRLADQRSEEGNHLLALIREFVEADAEMDREMERTNLEDFVKRPPVFDRYDAAVAALKEAVK